MPDDGDEAGTAEHAYGTSLAGIDDDGVVRLASDDEGHDTVLTHRGVAVDAVGAVDREGGVVAGSPMVSRPVVGGAVVGGAVAGRAVVGGSVGR